MKHCDVIEDQEAEKVIAPVDEAGTTVKYYVSDEDLFQILCSAHIKIGYGDCEIEWSMNSVLVTRTCNTRMKKGIIAKPIVFNKFNRRSQLYLIDLQL